jgi:glyoxylase-like metal-dependent hydrolase (beta-lactamase superfamily II)
MRPAAVTAGRRLRMTRALVLGTLVGVGALSLVVSGQAPAGLSAKAIAATKIEKVKDNLYIITGSGASDQTAFCGGNTAVFVTDAGVTLVDTKLPGYGPTLLERIKTVTSKPVTRIINTHAHGDHTGGNAFFGATVESIVHENAKKNMAAQPEYAGANATRLPTRTYKDKLTVGSGKDQIDVYYFGRGHTDGDSFIVFPALRTMHVGLKDYADFTRDFAAYAEASMKAGKTVEQAAADYRVAPKYKGYVVTIAEGFVTPKGNLQMAYDELKKK